MSYLGGFGQEFSKYCCRVLNQHPQICLIVKFWGKTRIPKFGTKNAWFRYFWAAIWKQYCDMWNQHPRICLIAKFVQKQKCQNLVAQNALFGYFWPIMLY